MKLVLVYISGAVLCAGAIFGGYYIALYFVNDATVSLGIWLWLVLFKDWRRTVMADLK